LVVIDTTVWIDYLNGVVAPRTDWLDREVGRQRLGLTDIILCEVLQGVREERRVREIQARLLSFEVLDSGGREIALAAARNYRTLRARGLTIRSTIDAWVGTFCLLRGHALLHNDRDFDHFEEVLGLEVVQTRAAALSPRDRIRGGRERGGDQQRADHTP
jgi:predicted nucleic acid-binding protein